jgi:hypothetical protein
MLNRLAISTNAVEAGLHAERIIENTSKIPAVPITLFFIYSSISTIRVNYSDIIALDKSFVLIRSI